MQSQLIKQLKKLKAIGPEANFIAASRQAILAAPQSKPFFIFPGQIWAWGGALAVLTLILVTALTGLTRVSPLLIFTNAEEINREFENLSINVQLQEISYRQNVNEVIASALGEISDSGPRYLKSAILEQELNSLEINGHLEKREKIDELFNKIIF